MLNNTASSVVSYVEPFRELVVNIHNRLLQGDDVPFSCNLFLESALFSTSRSPIPFVDAEHLLNGWAVWHSAVEDILERVPPAFEQMLHDILRRTFERQQHVVLRYRQGLLSPT